MFIFPEHSYSEQHLCQLHLLEKVTWCGGKLRSGSWMDRETVARHKNELSLQILEPSYVVSLVLRRQSWSLKTQTGLHKVVIQSHTHTGSTVRNATRRRYYHKAPPPPLFHQFDLFSVFHLRLSILLCVSLSLSLWPADWYCSSEGFTGPWTDHKLWIYILLPPRLLSLFVSVWMAVEYLQPLESPRKTNRLQLDAEQHVFVSVSDSTSVHWPTHQPIYHPPLYASIHTSMHPSTHPSTHSSTH